MTDDTSTDSPDPEENRPTEEELQAVTNRFAKAIGAAEGKIASAMRWLATLTDECEIFRVSARTEVNKWDGIHSMDMLPFLG